MTNLVCPEHCMFLTIDQGHAQDLTGLKDQIWVDVVSRPSFSTHFSGLDRVYHIYNEIIIPKGKGRLVLLCKIFVF